MHVAFLQVSQQQMKEIAEYIIKTNHCKGCVEMARQLLQAGDEGRDLGIITYDPILYANDLIQAYVCGDGEFTAHDAHANSKESTPVKGRKH